MKKTVVANLFLLSLILTTILSAVMAIHFFQQVYTHQILMAGSPPKYLVLYNYKLHIDQRASIFCLVVTATLIQGLFLVLLPSKKQQSGQRKTITPHVNFNSLKNASDLQEIIEVSKEHAQALTDPTTREQTTEEIVPNVASQGPANVVSQVVKKTKAADTSYHNKDKPRSLKELNDANLVDPEIILSVQRELTQLTQNNPFAVRELDDNDIVFGSKEITDRSIILFIYNFPSSVVKFLYQQSMNGSPISLQEKQLYNKWYDRGLSYEKVLAYLLTILDWDQLPDKPIYELLPLIKDELMTLN